MNDKDLVQEIMIMLQKKYNFASQILAYTQDINKSLSQSDLGTVEMLLNMRYSAMLEVENCNDNIDVFIRQLSENTRIRIQCQMSESSISSEVSFEEKKINEIYILNKNTIKKVIESDKVINSQITASSKLATLNTV